MEVMLVVIEELTHKVDELKLKLEVGTVSV
jgi:hypothetical protein